MLTTRATAAADRRPERRRAWSTPGRSACRQGEGEDGLRIVSAERQRGFLLPFREGARLRGRALHLPTSV